MVTRAFAARLSCAVLVAMLALAAGARAQGQPLRPAGTQDLDFGNVFPGVPERITRTDAANAGRFEIRGRLQAEVRITFTLPATLNASGGRTIPLIFGPGDGGSSILNNAAIATAFDPRVPLVTRLGAPGRLYLFLGGTANPSPTTTAGTYLAVITLTVAYTGN